MFNEKKLARFEFPAEVSGNKGVPLTNRVHTRFIRIIVLPVMFALVMFLLILMVCVWGEVLPATADVFAPYIVVFPGQSTEALVQFPCQMFDVYYGAPYTSRKFVCHLSLMEGVFKTVDIFASESTITGANFRVKHMRLVELVWRWGRPDRIYSVSGEYQVQWMHDVKAIAKIGQRYSMQAPVDLIIFTAQPSL